MISLVLILLAGQTDPTSPTSVDDVVVEGIRDAARAYVAQTIRPRRRGQPVAQIARWSAPVCVRVIGPERASARALEVGVMQTLKSLDVPTAGARCTPNAVIAVTDSPAEFSQQVARRRRFALFANDGASMQAFVQPGPKMRWMHRITQGGGPAPGSMSLTTDAQGSEPGGTATPAGRTMFSGGGAGTVIALPQSRIELSTEAQIDRAMIVIDTRVAEAAPRQPLIDYLAYTVAVDRADADDGKRGGVASLIGSEGLRDPAAVLTDQDVSFVRALYESNDRRSASMQGVDIINRMERQAREREAHRNE
ncbi:MAG: hypothetical protein ACT6RD_02330 [Brevundimonas sp.]|uniref:hypothetical protein n=1 Tax=Brevundimonas sp. TaxID=1871086 RepID=UPI004034E4C3